MDKKQQEQLRKALVFGGLGLLCGFILIRGSKDEPKGEGAEEPQPTKDQPLTELLLLFLIHSVLSFDE